MLFSTMTQQAAHFIISLVFSQLWARTASLVLMALALH
jgi:hypothetical protein